MARLFRGMSVVFNRGTPRYQDGQALITINSTPTVQMFVTAIDIDRAIEQLRGLKYRLSPAAGNSYNWHDGE